MSSHYTSITIPDKEWQQIQACVRDTDIYVAAQQQRINQIREEAARRAAENAELRRRSLAAINKAADQLGASFRTAISKLESTTMDEARRQSADFQGKVDSLRDDIHRTGEKTAQVKRQLGDLAKAYAEIVNGLIGQEQNAAKKAQIMLDSLEEQMEQIKKLQPEVFEPARYYELDQIIRAAAKNIEAGNYQSALITSQVSVAKASELLTELLVDNDTFDTALASALETAEETNLHFEELAREMEGKISFTVVGETFEQDYDIDHWSDGRYSELKAEFQSVFEQLQNAAKGKITVEQLMKLKQQAANLKAKLQRCDEAARNELVGSIWAQETAARVWEANQGKGWTLVSNGFEDDDDRKSYTMVFETPSGALVPIVFAPGERTDQPDIFLEVITDDPSQERILKESARLGLQQAGVHIEQSGRYNDCHLNTGSTNSERSGSFVKRYQEHQRKLREQRMKRNFS